MTETGPEVTIQPLVSWPRQVVPGGSYLVTVDLRLPEAAEEWPYDQEEFIIGCMLDGRPACKVRAIGAAGVVLHRFGGTYGPARFIAEVSDKPEDLVGAALWLTLTTEGGLPFYTGKLPLDGTPVPEVVNDQPGEQLKVKFGKSSTPAHKAPAPPPSDDVPANIHEEPALVPSRQPEHWPFYPTGLPGGDMPEKRVDPWISWEPCEGRQGWEALSRLRKDEELRVFFGNSTLVGSRWSRLPFYTAHRLMELQFARDRGVERAFVLHGPKRTWWLNGETAPIYEVNEAESLALTQSTVGDYIRFYFYFLRTDGGTFVLIESADEVGPRADADGGGEDQDEVLTLEAARDKARPLQMRGSDETGRWLVDVTVAYGGGLFHASLAVETGGDIDMTDDEPIGLLDALTVPEAPSLELAESSASRTPEQDEPPFGERKVAEYLRDRLGAGYPASLDIETVARLTYGIPLAVSLVSELLGGGLDPAIALAPVQADVASGVVPELVRRYLVHAHTIAALQPDLPLLYELALLDGEAGQPGLAGDPSAGAGLDPEALAVLWNVPVEAVIDRLDGLAERHDFMLNRSRRLYREMREPVLLFLLDPLERPAVGDLNARAAAFYRERADSTGHLTVDAQLEDQGWQTALIALLWHTFWADLDEGLQLLKGLFAVAVVDNSFAAALLRAATFFAPVCTADARRLISDLQLVSDPQLGGRRARAAEASARDVIKALKTTPAEPLLATTPPAAVYHDLLQARCQEALDLTAPERATLLFRAASDVERGGATARAITSQVRELAMGLEEYRDVSADTQEEIIAALGLPVRFDPSDADAHDDLGNALLVLGAYAEAEAAYHEAARLDPSNATYHSNLGATLSLLGRYAEAETAQLEALRLEPGNAENYNGLGYTLVASGRYNEAETVYREALRLEPGNADHYNSLGYTLVTLSRYNEAETAYREALRLDPSAANVHSSLGHLYLKLLGRVDEAESALREALRLEPNWVSAHANLGSLYVVTSDLGAARSSFLQATQSAPAKQAFSELMLGALDRSADPSAAEGHFTAALTALDRPDQPTSLTPFGRAEIQALAMAGLDRGQEATVVFASAMSKRSGADLFQRQHYEIFSASGLTPGIDALIAIWRDIIASDNSAVGPWGGPRT
jgi:Flp pilus assembly protein TadD